MQSVHFTVLRLLRVDLWKSRETIASLEVVLQLLRMEYIPILVYGLDVSALNNRNT